MQDLHNVPQQNILALAKTKINNICQEINQEVRKLLMEALQAMEPAKFLDAKLEFYFKPTSELLATNRGDFDESSEDYYSGLCAKFSGTVELVSSESHIVLRLHQSEDYETASESFGDSQGSCSSQSSCYSLVRGNGIPTISLDRCVLGGMCAAPSDLGTLAGPSPMPIDPSLKRSRKRTFGDFHKRKRLNGKYDPENHEIMRLRQEENLDFQDIADRLNEARSHVGGKDDLTDNAIYSRYTRNAPLIARMKNEKFVPTAKDNQYAKMKFAQSDPISGFDAQEDALLELAQKQIEEEFWTFVSKRIEELGGAFHDPKMCEQRFGCF